MPTPAERYADRLAARLAALARLESRSARYSAGRMAVFLVGAALLWPVVFAKTVSAWWLAAPVVVFVALAIGHERVLRRLRRTSRAVEVYRAGLARLEDRWPGTGIAGGSFADDDHPYASDLDVFGPGSLFELFSRARTRAGARTLAGWLCAPAAAGEIRRRQAAVDELVDALTLREDVLVLADEVREDDDPDALAAWSGAAPLLAGRWPVVVAALLGIANYVALGAWFVRADAKLPALAVLAVSGLFALVFRPRVLRVLHAAERPEHELELLAGVLGRLERERFDAPLLAELKASLDADGRPPSRRVKQLARLVELRDSRENKLFMPFAALGFAGTQLAFAMERWRATSGSAVPRWIDAVGRFEALASLASIAFERPDDVVPEIVERGPLLDAEGIGHPLLPASTCVRNDVRLDDERRLLLVSGSNMSGKSTLLRTVGVNVALALAGARVRARAMRVSPMQLGACMRVRDSLLDGRSHFYAEISRLRSVVDLADRSADGAPTLLFLLDEILHGTNSNDRLAGGRALIRGLLERGAIGLVTTHDLALAAIADEIGAAARNVHFEDRLDGERIEFDYRLKPGVVERGNALALMRAVGLEV